MMQIRVQSASKLNCLIRSDIRHHRQTLRRAPELADAAISHHVSRVLPSTLREVVRGHFLNRPYSMIGKLSDLLYVYTLSDY